MMGNVHDIDFLPNFFRVLIYIVMNVMSVDRDTHEAQD